MKKLLSVVLGIFVAGASPAAELVMNDSFSVAPFVQDASRTFLVSRVGAPTSHMFDDLAESGGGNRYGYVGGTISVTEDSYSVAPEVRRYAVEVTALDVAGDHSVWVSPEWSGIGLIRWRLDVGSTGGGTDPINFDSPVEIVDSGYSVFDRWGNWLGDYELYADTSTATSLSGVAIHSNGGQDIAGVDVSTIQMWWDVRQSEAAPPPTVVTSPASSIGETAARLNGSADPNGASTNAWFQWGTSTAYGNTTALNSVGSGTSPVSYSSNLSALQCGTTYHFRAVAQNSGGTTYGSDRSFTTSACSTPAPTVVTSPASTISETAARLNGRADPNGLSTKAWFEWGTSSSYGNVTSPQTNVGLGTYPISYGFNLSALACGTTYYFRAVAQNSGGTAYGTGGAFTTSACSSTPPPTVVTSPASSIGETAARLNGSADPNGASTNAWFQWGTSSSYGNVTSPQTSVGSGTSPVSFPFNLGSLACGTTYYFRAVAQNSGGTAYGTGRAFTTSACSSTPTVVTSPASNIGETAARLNGSADPNGASTNAWFQWGTSSSYGNVTSPQTSVGSGTSPVSFSFNLGSLACGTTYHFRAVASNTGGTAYGSDRSFTTSACQASSFTVGGTVSGLSGSGLVLRNNGGDPLTISSNGSFTFNTPLDDGSAYSVSVGNQPAGPDQTCSVANGTGTISGVGITDVSVTCVTDPGQEDVLLESRFETASKEGWSSKGKVAVDGILAIDQYSLRHGGGARSVYSVSTAGYENVSITMHLAATSLRSGDACFAEVSTDGGDSWMPVVTVQGGDTSSIFFSGTVSPSSAVDNVDVQLRFSASGRGNKGYCYGDEVYVTGTLIGG